MCTYNSEWLSTSQFLILQSFGIFILVLDCTTDNTEHISHQSLGKVKKEKIVTFLTATDYAIDSIGLRSHTKNMNLILIGRKCWNEMETHFVYLF